MKCVLFEDKHQCYFFMFQVFSELCNFLIRDCKFTYTISMGRDSSVGVATSYGLDGRGIESRWGGEIFSNRRDPSWGSPSLVYNGYGVSFPGVKRPGRDVNHPLSPSAKVKERVELYSPLGFHGLF
jgi:hypothetical protein